jgi:hypothetical protein
MQEIKEKPRNANGMRVFIDGKKDMQKRSKRRGCSDLESAVHLFFYLSNLLSAVDRIFEVARGFNRLSSSGS